ncbi:ndr1/hin1-like protein [Anaeramoeba ignava]|uniref:Ndr1/hin1-like protein n=1 Tax=Anaeramoeba ignava TaxID=1746090 RepID=A0A9Q0LH94_ANAIG|nr:ndr1/hin1-like protein [Anaeramoeba ignava]
MIDCLLKNYDLYDSWIATIYPDGVLFKRIRFGSDNQSLVFQPEKCWIDVITLWCEFFISFFLPQISNFSKENFSLITDSNNFKKATIEFQIENNGEVSGMIVGYLSCNNSDLVINPDNPKQMNISSNSKSSLVFEVDYESSLDEDAKIECELDISQNSLPLWNITYENETVNGLIIPIYNGCLFQRADPYFPVDGISGIQVDNFDTNQESNENSFQLKFLVKINNSPVSAVFSLDCFINSSLILHETNSINFSQSEIQKYVDWIVVFESSFEYPFSIQCEIESEIEMESCWSNNSKFSNSSFDFLFQIQQDQKDSSGFWNSKLGSFLYKMGGDSKLGGVFCFIFFLLLFLTLLIFVPLFLLFKSKKKKLFQNQSKDFELKKVKNENLQKEFEMDQVVENPLKKKREKMKDLEKNADELLSQIGIEEEEKKRNKKSGLTLKEKMERDFDSIINQK